MINQASTRNLCNPPAQSLRREVLRNLWINKSVVPLIASVKIVEVGPKDVIQNFVRSILKRPVNRYGARMSGSPTLQGLRRGRLQPYRALQAALPDVSTKRGLHS